MKLCGLQKLSLLDFPQKLCCTVFTGGCDLRCPFCHNASLVLLTPETDELSEDDFFNFLETRKGRLDGVCVSGGEPLLQPDIERFLQKIRDAGFAVKLDTNGTHPDALRSILDKKLVDYVAMDIKNCQEKYPLTVGREGFEVSSVIASAKMLMTGEIPFEFRTTVAYGMHTPEDIAKIGEWLDGAPKYYIQNFKDSGDILADGISALTQEEMAALLEAAKPHFGIAEIRGE